MAELKLFETYSRKDVHDIFAPEANFTPQAGTWGLQGIIEIPDRPDDFVLFVTFGRTEGEHSFDEGISTDGILRWQSQPRQGLSDPTVVRLINHDEDVNNVHLFLRPKDRSKGVTTAYTYLGTLKYVTHDNQRERPVHFDWQLLAWPIPGPTLTQMGLHLEDSLTSIESLPMAGSATPAAGQPTLVPDLTAPEQGARRGVATSRFTRRYLGDYAERERTNRSLGLAGELLVVQYERDRLRQIGRADLAEKVRHVSAEEGDGAGYDILSFKDDGSPRYIEVKTTRGPKTTEFFLSPNEVEFSKAQADHFELRRIYGYDRHSLSCCFFSLYGAVDAHFELTPTEFKISRLRVTVDE